MPIAGSHGNTIKNNVVDQKHNSEICFIGQTTLDNGLTVGVNVQIEANTEADQVDETYLFLQGRPSASSSSATRTTPAFCCT